MFLCRFSAFFEFLQKYFSAMIHPVLYETEKIGETNLLN